MNRFKASLIPILILLMGCTNPTIPTDGDNNPTEPRKNDALPTIPMNEYLTFWDSTTRLDLTFEMNSQHLQWMSDAGEVKNDIRNDIYFPMTMHLTMNDNQYLLNEVGIRMKGNIYSRGVIAEDGALVAPSGFKLSFNETFSEPYYENYGIRKTWDETNPAFLRRKDRTLFGMEKLDLKWNRSQDPSMITQAFSYHLFNQWTLISPQSTLGTLTFQIGDLSTRLGIMMLNEPIDKTLIRRHFNKAEAQGDLYKALWPVDLNMTDVLGRSLLRQTSLGYQVNPDVIGVENTFENYHPTYDLKTNKKTSKHTHLINLILTLQNAGTLPFTQRKAAIESVVHIPSFLQYAAASYLMGNPDDMRANVNNTYIYFHPTTGRAYFIPYDYDWTLGLTWSQDLDEAMRSVSPLYNVSPVHGQTIENPLFWYTILEENDSRFMSDRYPIIKEFQNTYLNYVNLWKNSQTFSVASFSNMFQNYRLTYGDWTSDVESHSHFITINRFIIHRDGIVNSII